MEDFSMSMLLKVSNKNSGDILEGWLPYTALSGPGVGKMPALSNQTGRDPTSRRSCPLEDAPVPEVYR